MVLYVASFRVSCPDPLARFSGGGESGDETRHGTPWQAYFIPITIVVVAGYLDTLQPFPQMDSEQLADECFTNATCNDTQTHYAAELNYVIEKLPLVRFSVQ